MKLWSLCLVAVVAAQTSIKDLFPDFDTSNLLQFDGEVFPGQVLDVDYAGILCGDNVMMSVFQKDDYPGFHLFEPRNLTLFDSGCSMGSGNIEVIGDQIFTITPLDRCGTEAEIVDELVIFSNIMTNAAMETHNGITIHAHVELNMTCSYSAVYELSQDSNVLPAELDDMSEEVGLFDISLNFYEQISGDRYERADSLDSLTMTSAPFTVGEIAHFVVEMENPNDKVVMQVTSCRMSDDKDEVEYEFIVNDCPDPFTNTQLSVLSAHQSLASFTMFEFTHQMQQATQTNFVGCSVKICLDQADCSATCL
jgi:hypothetical protein